MSKESDIEPISALAFLGYSFADENDSGDAFKWLGKAIVRAVEDQHGIDIKLFDGFTEPGPWQQSTANARRDVQIFLGPQIYIPLITPNFLASDLCRREAQDFLSFLQRPDSNAMIMPIHLATTDIAGDDDLQDLSNHIFDDWRSLDDQLRGERGRTTIYDRIHALAAAIGARLSNQPSFEDLPFIPEQGAGPHFRINEDGLIDRAPDDARQSIENEARMASLQMGLKAGCDRLLGAGISQNAFGYLIDDIRAYQDAISLPVREIQFTDVWRLGLVLQDHADAVSRNVDRLGASLEDDQQAALKSLVGLHGPFILSSEEGRELQALSQESRATRDELKAFQEAADQFVEAMKGSTDLVTERARDLIEDANQGIAEGRYPERHTVTAQTTNQNFLSVVGAAAAFVGGTAASGIIGEGVAASGVGIEFTRLCTETIDAAASFLFSHEVILKGLAAAGGEGLNWVPHLIQWLKAWRKTDEKRNPIVMPNPSLKSRKVDCLTLSGGTVFRDIDADWCPELVVIPAGSFTMGSSEDEKGRDANEGPQHEVHVRRSFAIGRYPVTFDEFDHFCSDLDLEKPNDEGWGRGRRPVVNVSSETARAYCEWLSSWTKASYGLPSEACWEFACRAGSETPYSVGRILSENQANFGRNIGQTTEVGSYPANAWGLFDTHGNVWEWCEDHYSENYFGAPNDGSAWYGNSQLGVVRGGSWRSRLSRLRSATRDEDAPGLHSYVVGFRCARILEPVDNNL